MKKLICAAAAAIIAAGSTSCGTNRKNDKTHQPYESVICDYCIAMTKADPDALLDCMLPKEAVSAAKAAPDHDAVYDSGKKGLTAVQQGWVKSCGANPVMSLEEVKSSEKLDDTQLHAAESYLISASAEYGVKDLSPKITEGYETVLSLVITGAEYETTMENTCCMVNIDGDGWKIITSDADTLSNNAD